MKLGTFTIVKNEAEFIGYGIMSVLDHVDEMVFADGNSTDGTIEIIEHIQKTYDKKGKIKLFKNKDCKNLQKDYVKLFNWTIAQCKSDYIWFLHPDMICTKFKPLSYKNIRYNVGMVSIAGDNRELIISEGRADKWATIFKNDYGLHYYGFYGSREEDMYFRDITGNSHIYYKQTTTPYIIGDSCIELFHYCDTKPYTRRLQRMIRCLENQQPNASKSDIREFAINHPRVSLQNGTILRANFAFKHNNLPKSEVFDKYNFERFRK